ncbi:MAG: methyltransferase [Burkholderiales bacterium]
MEFAPPSIADLLIAAFAALEALRWRRGDYARTLPYANPNRGTTAVLIGCYGVAVLTLNWSAPSPLPLPRWAEWTGIAVGLGGLVLRWWAVKLPWLHAIRPADAGAMPRVIRCGPYRIIHQPVYLGNLAIWFGVTMASGNLIALITVVVAMVAAYAVLVY